MHRSLVLLLLTAASAAPLTTTLAAQAPIPATLSFQGRLALQAGGNANGVLPFTFRVYNLPTGGLPRWTEAKSSDSLPAPLPCDEAAPPPRPISIAGPPSSTIGAPAGTGRFATCARRTLPTPPAIMIGL